MAYEAQPYDVSDIAQTQLTSLTTDAPGSGSTAAATGDKDPSGNKALRCAGATVIGALALLYLFGTVLMKDARL